MAQMQPVSFGGVLLGATATTIGTVSSKGKWIFQKLTLHNTGSDNAEVQIYLVPNSATPEDRYLIAKEVLAADETWSCPGIERLVGGAGATLQGISDPATINAVGAALEWT